MEAARETELDTAVQALLDAGDVGGAATRAIKGYGPQILGYLTAVLRDGDDADDAFGRFAEDLWNGIEGFRGESSLKTWCYKLAWHAALRVARDPYRRRKQTLGTTDASALAAEVRSSTVALGATSARGRLERLRAQLEPDEQTMIILRFDRRLSWREVAEVLAEAGDPVDEAALRKRYARLKEKLRKLAEGEGIGTR